MTRVAASELGLLAGLITLAACGGSGGPSATAPVSPLTVSMAVVSGNSQSAPVGTKLADALRVRILDRSGHPVQNFVVNFVVTSGGGQVFAPAEQTDAQGIAEEVWTLGPRLGAQTVAVRSVDPHTGQPITYGNFSATGLPPRKFPVVIANGKGIVRMNSDGTDVVQLTTDPHDSVPDLSSDHTKIAFLSDRSGTGYAIYLMNADGSHVHPITGFSGFAGPPSFSPDGTMLVFMMDEGVPPADQIGAEVTDTSGNIVGGLDPSRNGGVGRVVVG